MSGLEQLPTPLRRIADPVPWQVMPSREDGCRNLLLSNTGSPFCMPAWSWQRMQKSPKVPFVSLTMLECIALNTGLSWAYAWGETLHSL